MGDMTVVESGITRQLQHAILQLCNEHVSYEHTMQVLGVVCVTVDDRPRDIVIKLNNTLKRVDAAPAATDDRRPARVRTSAAATLWPRAPETASSSSGSSGVGSTACDGGGLGELGSGRQTATAACTEPTPVAMVVSSARKCHGRKQSNPVKVKAVANAEEDNDNVDDDDDEDDHEDAASSELGGSGGVLLIAPAEPSAADEELSTSPSSVGEQFRGVNEDSPLRERRCVDQRTPTVSGTSAVRALLIGKAEKAESVRAINADVISTARSMLSSPHCDGLPEPIVVVPTEYKTSDKLLSNDDEQEAALNFSTRTVEWSADADGRSSPDCDVDIKQELQPARPLPSYGLDLAARGASTFDMSSSMTVAAAAAAFSQYVDDPAVLHSMSSYDQQRLAFYTSLVTAAAASGVPPTTADDGRPAAMSLLNGSCPNGSERASSRQASSSYTVTSRRNDGLTMHRVPGVRRRERLSHHCQPPAKVKDIIMYDDSAPLHVQRGSRIEGDFMLDALHVEGRKRRRRTAEDTLTPEEIAEYMGTSTSSGSGQFACRYCGEVTADLSRYFAHTLTSHGSFVCHQCGKSFTTKSSLLRHRPIHTGMRRFACSICRKSFYRKDKCKAHIKRHLGLVDGPGRSSPLQGLPLSAGPATPQLPLSVDHQLMASSTGPVNLAV